MIVTLNEVDLQLPARRWQEHTLINFELLWSFSTLLCFKLANSLSLHRTRKFAWECMLFLFSSQPQMGHRTRYEESLLSMPGRLWVTTSMADDVVDGPTIRDVLINLGGNGEHPKTSVDTGIFLRLDILPDESMSTLSTQRAIGKRFWVLTSWTQAISGNVCGGNASASRAEQFY